MPLHIDLRPTTLQSFVGNDALKANLQAIIQREDRPRTFLFVGPSGTGKTTLARILAKELKCEDIDLYEYNSANLRGIDTVRELIAQANLSPKGPCKFYILDEIHQQTNAAQEAMLKMLEDAPRNCYYALATTAPEKLLTTIKTRCTTFTTTKLTSNEMESLVVRTVLFCNKVLDNAVLGELVKSAEGCPREAMKLLDQILAIDDRTKQLEILRNTNVSESAIIDICRRLFKDDVGYSKWVDIRTMLVALPETDPEKVRRSILGYLQAVLLKVKTNEGGIRVARLMEEFNNNYYSTGKSGLTKSLFLACQIGKD